MDAAQRKALADDFRALADSLTRLPKPFRWIDAMTISKPFGRSRRRNAAALPHRRGAAAAGGGARPDDGPCGERRRRQRYRRAEERALDLERWPFYGDHQQGIVTPRPANGMVASFTVVADKPADLDALFPQLTERIVFLTQGGTPPDLNPKLPPADSGILGPVVTPDT